MFIMCLDRKNNCHIVDYVFGGSIKTICGLSLKKIDSRLNTIASDNIFDIPCGKCMKNSDRTSNWLSKNPRFMVSSMARKNNDVVSKPLFKINLLLKRWSKLIRLNISMNRKINPHK